MAVRRAALLLLIGFLSACATLPRSGAIAGTVADAAGRPLDGVRVILQAPGSAAPVLSAADPMVRTDASGRFAFDTPPPGRHQILLLHPTLGWLIAQGARPGPPVRLIFDGKTRVVPFRQK